MRAIALLAVLASVVGTSLAAAETIAVDSPSWVLEGAKAEVSEYQGVRSLYLFGAVATLQNADFDTGVIEFDMAIPSNAPSFPGVYFRGVDASNYEHFYLRPHQNGNPDSMQYTPFINNMTGWQIYKEYNGKTRFPIAQWFHVRMEIGDDSARMFVGSDEPALIVGDLQREQSRGYVAFKGSSGGAYFANIEISPGTPDADPPERIQTELPAGQVRTWQVSPSMDESSAMAAAASNDLKTISWSALPVEYNGIANLSRVAVFSPERGSVLARIALSCQRARSMAMQFGFSDRVRIYVNGNMLYAGDDAQASRDYRFLGTVGLYDALYLPLRRGRNDVVFVVSEGGEGRIGGGWAANAVLPESSGCVEVSAGRPTSAH